MRPGDVLALRGAENSVLFVYDETDDTTRRQWVVRGLDYDEAFTCLVVSVVPARSVATRADLTSFSRWVPKFSYDGPIALLHVTCVINERLGVHEPRLDPFNRFTSAPFVALVNNNTERGNRGPLVLKLA